MDSPMRDADLISAVKYEDATYEYTCISAVGRELEINDISQLLRSEGRQIIRKTKATGSLSHAKNQALAGSGLDIRGTYQCSAKDLATVAAYDYDYDE